MSVRGAGRRGRWNPARAVVAAVVVALVLAGCSSSGKATSTTSAPTGVGATTATTASTGSTTTTSIGAATTTTTVAGEPATSRGPEGVPIPAGTALGSSDNPQYPQTIDSIPCQTSEQVAYHIHAVLTIFVNGMPRQVPYGIGIGRPLNVAAFPGGNAVNAGTCFYWLHTHAADGVIHVESPTPALYTLGQFFDVWGQSLSQNQVGSATGAVTVFVNGQPYTGDPRAIQVMAHLQIQLDVGTPTPAPTLITFPAGL